MYKAPFNFETLSKEKVGVLTDKSIYERAKGYPCTVIGFASFLIIVFLQ